MTITIRDLADAPFYGLSVEGAFNNPYGMTYVSDCPAATCALGGYALADSIPSTVFNVVGITRGLGSFPIAEGDSLQFNVYNPNPTTPTPTPTPTPATHHIGDLDNATSTLSSSLGAASSLKAASSRNWRPRVTATVLDSTGTTVAGATISGTFSHHKGTLTCTTVANGTCTLGNFSLSRSTKTTVFTVTGVVKASSTYAPKTNSDPDGDSNGTDITLSRP